MTAPMQLSAPTPGEVHVWHADLDREDWPAGECLPGEERHRAARIVAAKRRRRWAASRWALRIALSRYVAAEPSQLELSAERGGKPRLTGDSMLRFNLSHSGELALIAIAAGRDVGIDVERRGRRPTLFYEDWVRREAIGKCFGVGLAAPPNRPVRVLSLACPDDGWVAALAVAGTREPLVRRRGLEPAATDASARQ